MVNLGRARKNQVSRHKFVAITFDVMSIGTATLLGAANAPRENDGSKTSRLSAKPEINGSCDRQPTNSNAEVEARMAVEHHALSPSSASFDPRTCTVRRSVVDGTTGS